jgi:hypothetical protein
MIKIAFDPIYAHPLPENHRFPMLKYQLIPEQLIYEGLIPKIIFLLLVFVKKKLFYTPTIKPI